MTILSDLGMDVGYCMSQMPNSPFICILGHDILT